ncbi:MAG TPA: chemotaxis protein CheW [Verrucomicrobiae bacterium]|nr:chemotaxis protein CheW [Verrucomicrobiae bacterium]
MKARSNGAVRWEEVRARLARVTETATSATRLSPAQARELMDERARRLSAPTTPKPTADEVLEVVTFTLAGGRCGIDARWVCEVIRLGDLTPVPSTPDVLLGLTNLRGELLPVVDLRRLFALPRPEATPLARIIVLGGERAELGALVDEVHEVAMVHTGDVMDSAWIAGAGREYLRGVTCEGLVLLDAARLFTDGRLLGDESDHAGGEPARRGAQ